MFLRDVVTVTTVTIDLDLINDITLAVENLHDRVRRGIRSV